MSTYPSGVCVGGGGGVEGANIFLHKVIWGEGRGGRRFVFGLLLVFTVAHNCHSLH